MPTEAGIIYTARHILTAVDYGGKKRDQYSYEKFEDDIQNKIDEYKDPNGGKSISRENAIRKVLTSKL